MIHRFHFTRLAVLVLAVAIPFAAFGQPITNGRGNGATIEWSTNTSGHDSIELVAISPSGESYRKTYPAGRPLTLSIRDLGTSPEEGQYSYEFRVIPRIPAGLAKKLQDARAANDEAAARKAMKEYGITPVTHSGTFSVVQGGFLYNQDPEPGANDSASAEDSSYVRSTEGATGPAASSRRAATPRVGVNDQVIPDDLIVQSSTCTGFDCVDGESFGFDTLRLKENNLRIHFEDTSATAGYPANDWRLEANDSASGGANRFSIIDATTSRNVFNIVAAAPASSMYVASTGKVGFRNSAPLLDLHMTTNDTPAIRFEQSNAGGFTAQTWDIGANEANFFVRDLTGGSKLSFRIRPGAPTSSIDIAADGEVGVGTASPEAKLHAFGSSTADTFVGIGEDPDGSTGTQSALNIGMAGASFGRGAGFMNVRPDSNAVAPNPSLRFATANVTRMIIDNEGFIALGSLASAGGNPTSPIHYTNGATTALLTTAGVWQDASSREAKENINELSSDAALQALRELKPVSYNYKVVPTDPKVGFIAEEVPEIVATPERKGLSALDIVAVVTKVVQEQQKTIEQLTERIAQLEAEKAQQQ